MDQQLIQTEMKVKHRTDGENNNGSSPHGPLAPKIENAGLPGARCRPGDGENKPRANTAGDVGLRKLSGYMNHTRSTGGVGRRCGGGEGHRGGGRHRLRVQMKIERKRARLFEDIRLLPYT